MDFVIIFFAKYLAWVLGAALILFIFLGDRKKRIYITIQALIAGTISRFGITELIRYFYDRPRPFEVIENARQILEHDPGGSFPSGHAAFFFALAGTIFIYDKRWGTAFFLGAVFMGIARVMADVHWTSDIIGGAAVGIVSSFAVYFLYKVGRL